MSVSATPALLACGIFGAGMLHAAVTDLRHRRIRNWLVAALAVSWAPMALVVRVPVDQMASSVLAAALVFAVGFGFFAAGWLGGGDVKLAAVAVLWLGAGQAVAFLLLSAVLGAGLAWPLLLVGRKRRHASGSCASASPGEVPYGPALALAGIALLQGSPWAAAV